MYIHTHIYTYTCTYIHADICTHRLQTLCSCRMRLRVIQMPYRGYTYLYNTRIYTCIHTYMYVVIHTYIYMYVRTFIQAYINTYRLKTLCSYCMCLQVMQMPRLGYMYLYNTRIYIGCEIAKTTEYIHTYI